MRYNRNAFCAEVGKELGFFQHCNVWLCHLIPPGVSCSGVKEHDNDFRPKEEQKTALKKKGIAKTVPSLTGLALESQFGFIWA